MTKKIFVWIVSILWLVPMAGNTDVSTRAADVVRLIPITGTPQDVPVASLQKIVFTTDSIVFVPAVAVSGPTAVQQTVYKYAYSAMLFEQTLPTDIEPQGVAEQSESVKFIQDGRLYIRRGTKIYDVYGRTAAQLE